MDYAVNISSVLLIASIGGVTLNPIVLATLTTAGIL